jgi:hypothetical protein
VICDLLASEINAGLQTFAFDILRAWLGDELNGSMRWPRSDPTIGVVGRRSHRSLAA